MAEPIVVLPTLPRHVRFSTVEGARPETVHRITLRPKGGMPLKIAASLRSSQRRRWGAISRP